MLHKYIENASAWEICINVSLKYINEGLYFNERLLKERKMENKSRKCEKKKKETCFKGKKLINAGL